MKQLIICCFCIIFFSGFSGMAQIGTINCDTGSYSVFRKYKGDMIKVSCDTIYLLNKFTFDLMYRSYNDFRNQNLLLGQYTLLNDSISGLYESQLDTQRLYFDTLNAYFNKLANSADTLVNRSKTNLGIISNNLDSIQSQIVAAKLDITDAQKNIEEEKKQAKRRNWKWGIGGFTIGGVLAFALSVIL